ncbi:MAG: tetratricopeptide repeat protein [candidate division WOR-3 bacterium]
MTDHIKKPVTNGIVPSQISSLSDMEISNKLYKAISQNDKDLLEYAKNYQNNLCDYSRISFSKSYWSCPLFYRNGVLVRYHVHEFNSIGSFQKHLEILRAEAEAVLIHHKLGFCKLTDTEKEYYTRRALGILPSTTAEQLREIASYKALKKYRELKELLADIQELQNLGQHISKNYGDHLALVFFLLVHGSANTLKEFSYYGEKLDLIFKQLVSCPELASFLDHRACDNSFHSRYILITTLRDIINKKLPQRIKNDQIISFTTFLENFDFTSAKIEAAEFIFAAFDSFVLSKLGFNTEFVFINNDLQIEIILPERLLYWDSISNKGINYQKPIVKYRNNYQLIIALVLARTAQFYFQFGRDLNLAVTYYKNAISLFPYYPDFYKELAQLYLKNNQFGLAIEIIKRSIEIFPNDANFYYLLGVANYMNKEYEVAIANFRRAISLHPNYVEALNDLAICYKEINKYDQALIVYNQLLKINPNYYLAYYGIANVYYALKNYNQAVTYYQRAISINQQFEEGFYNLAQAYYELGDIEMSIKTYKRLLQIAPKHARAWYNLGVIYRNKGMKREAVNCLERAIKLNPNLF